MLFIDPLRSERDFEMDFNGPAGQRRQIHKLRLFRMDDLQQDHV